MTILELTCRDPIVARDGRPFGAGQGNRMRAVGWPLPSVVAGSLRTALGKESGREFSVPHATDLLEKVAVAGVLPVADGRLYLPAPQDCVIEERAEGPAKGMFPHRVAPPLNPDEGGRADWPLAGLRPVTLTTEQAAHDFKPKSVPGWWPLAEITKWLTEQAIHLGGAPFLEAPLIEERMHVRIDAATGAAKDENLFSTAALALTHLPRYGKRPADCWQDRFAPIALTARVRAADWCAETAARLNVFHPLGGERRLVHWRVREKSVDGWKCPAGVRERMTSATKRVRMVLATPAIFAGGWKPGWLATGTPPGSGVRLKLVGVTIQRWRAVSGWSLADLPGRPRGPKPVKRMVPAGGVYFFEVDGGNPEDLADRWLEPVSDDPQDQRDGFGLAVWGTWEPNK